MKRTLPNISAGNLLMGVILVLAASILSACTDSGNDILKTVPKDSPLIAMVKGEKAKEFLKADLSSPLVVFKYDRATLVTFTVENADSFRKDYEKEHSTEFRKVDGLWMLGDNTAFIMGNQVWLKADYPEIQPASIKALTALQESRSALSIDPLASLADSDPDLCWLSTLETLTGDDLSMQSSLLIGFLLGNVDYVAGSAELSSGGITGEGYFLDRKFNRVSPSVSLSEISIGSPASFQGKGNAFLIMGIDSRLASALSTLLAKFPLLPSEIRDLVKDLDGNVVINAMVESLNEWPEEFSMEFTMKSAEAASKGADALRQMFGGADEALSISAEGSTLRISSLDQVNQTVSLNPADLKNSSLCFAYRPDSSKGKSGEGIQGLKSLEVRIVEPDDSPAIIKFSIDCADPVSAIESLCR